MQHAGLTVLPLVGDSLSYLLGSTEIVLLGHYLTLTKFTAPALFVAVMSVAVFLLLYFVFQDGELLLSLLCRCRRLPIDCQHSAIVPLPSPGNVRSLSPIKLMQNARLLRPPPPPPPSQVSESRRSRMTLPPPLRTTSPGRHRASRSTQRWPPP